MKKIAFLLILFSIFLSSCGIYKRSDVKDNPVSVNERVAKNLKEGKGVRFLNSNKGAGGVFDFASSNPMWRATIDILDFITFANASYSGGIIVTDWFNDNSQTDQLRDLKITVKFLSNEIRADGIKIDIHERICKVNNTSSCSINKIKSEVAGELKLAILKSATRIDKNMRAEKVKNFKRKLTLDKNDEGNKR
jgi:hypothetical protein